MPFQFTCDKCGDYLIATSRLYVCCPRGCGRLMRRPERFLSRMRELRNAAWKSRLPVVVSVHKVKRRKRYVLACDNKAYRLASRAVRRNDGEISVVAANYAGQIVYLTPADDK